MHMTDKQKSHANQGHANPDKGGRDQYKRHVDGDITIRGQVETYVPPGAAEQHNTERSEDKAQAKKNYVVGVLTLLVVVVYAGITFWQGCLTRSAVKQTGDQFLLDQRPWLSPKDVPIAGGPVEPGAHFTVHLQVENTGKSPGIHSVSSTEASVKVCPDEFPPPAATGIPFLPEKPPYTYATIFPGRTQGGEFIDYPLDKPTVDNLESGSCGFYIWGQIWYCDLAHVAHYQHFCWKWHRGTAREFDVCTTFNDGDQDHPEKEPKPCPAEWPAGAAQ